jgi:hypothetical protein
LLEFNDSEGLEGEHREEERILPGHEEEINGVV